MHAALDQRLDGASSRREAHAGVVDQGFGPKCPPGLGQRVLARSRFVRLGTIVYLITDRL